MQCNTGGSPSTGKPPGIGGEGRAYAPKLLMAIVTINAWNRIGITTRLDPASLSGVDAFDLGEEDPA